MIDGSLIPTGPLRDVLASFLAGRIVEDAGGGSNRTAILEAVVQAMGYSRESTTIVDRHLARDAVDLDFADRLLSALDRPDAWFLELAHLTKHQALVCEDCDRPITAETGYRPLDLFRIDPDAPAGKRANAGGRRFRVYDLCRRCAGEALRLRASKSPKIGHGGRLGMLRTRDRVAPVRGGRPRLLTDEQIRQAHVLYDRGEISLTNLAQRMLDSGHAGTYGGLYSALWYGFKRLHLPVRPRGLAVAMSRHGTDGTKSRPWKKRCAATLRDGRRCTQYVRRVVTDTSSHPHEDGLCWNHGVGARAAA